MTGVCAFWHLSPRDYDQITLAELAAMFDHMERDTEQRRKAAAQRKARIRRARR